MNLYKNVFSGLIFVACRDTSLPTDKYLAKLNSSHWLDYVRDVLICSCVTATFIHKEGKAKVTVG